MGRPEAGMLALHGPDNLCVPTQTDEYLNNRSVFDMKARQMVAAHAKETESHKGSQCAADAPAGVPSCSTGTSNQQQVTTTNVSQAHDPVRHIGEDSCQAQAHVDHATAAEAVAKTDAELGNMRKRTRLS